MDPNFTYAYTLCGHESLASGDLDKAASYYRKTILCDERHYNAWYASRCCGQPCQLSPSVG